MRDLVRVGIDVGGTFTHAVAIDAATQTLRASVRVPTTHRAALGVAEGVREALRMLLDQLGQAPGAVSLIAHSTTQATNALLEGDVATVGVLAASVGRSGMGKVTSARTRGETDVGDTPIGEGGSRSVPVRHVHVECAAEELESAALTAIETLRSAGCQVIVAAEAFSIEDPSNERRVVELAVEAGLPATATSDISLLHGLRQRTRTAVVNASILPKMSDAARCTEEGARALGVDAPLLIVRSDGGTMSASEAARRPLLTVLSGPAAGVAAALMHVGIADGVFVEVGGTSTDLSAIVDGRPTVRAATTGGHRLYLRTLAVRTLGVAGGSMPLLGTDGIASVGPRSAHIAGLPYYGYGLPAPPLRATTVAPLPGDPGEYVVLEDEARRRWAFTLTCASRTLRGEIPEEGAAAAGRLLGLTARELCEAMVDRAIGPLSAAVLELASEHGLDGPRLALVGGGGGAEALVPYLGERMSVPWTICPDAPVISAIGAALAMLHETVERNASNPSPADVAAVREEARQALLRHGASDASVEVKVEFEAAAGILRATATGATTLAAGPARIALTDDVLSERAAAVLRRFGADEATRVGSSGFFTIYQGEVRTRRALGLLRRTTHPICVLDSTGAIRLQRPDGRCITTTAQEAAQALAAEARYGDAGLALPPARVLSAARIVDVSGLATPEQAAALLQAELAGVAADSQVQIVVG